MQKVIGPYEVLEQLGSGGMGVVYRARDARLQRDVAIKVLPDGFLGAGTPGQGTHERFLREARSASALNHPNICTIHDVGEQDGKPYLVMELLHGETLKETLKAGALPLGQVLEFAIQITRALEEAHETGIIHRDIKPANIFIVRKQQGAQQAKILDFGLAKQASSSSPADATFDSVGVPENSLTTPGSTVGTVAYMSPEQARGEPLDARSDLFSLGSVIYEMATGKLPFAGTSTADVFASLLKTDPEPPRKLNPGVSKEGERIILKLLAKDRTLRYQTATEVRRDLEQLAARSGSSRTAAASPGMGASSRRAFPIIPVAGGTLAIALAVGAYLWWHGHTPASKGAAGSSAAHGLTDKDTIVLADFSNSTGDAVFDDTLKTALSVGLNQSPFLNVLSDNKVAATLKLMTRPGDTRLTPDVARELCQRAGSKAYLTGSIATLGSQYVLALKAVNCQSGEPLAEQQVTAASKEKVLDALGEAATKLRGELGESLATVQKFDVPLSEATTSSLEALKAYSLGEKASNEKGTVAGLPYDQRAIELDPNFAMGYAAVGTDYHNLGELGRASEYITKAFQLREHASEREKLAISAQYYSEVTGELDKAAQAYQEAIESYPRQWSGYDNLGLVFAQQGQYEKAVEVTRQALPLAPDRSAPYENLANYTFALQRLEEARQVIHEAQARKVDDFALHLALYALAFLGSDSAAMGEQQQWFAGKPEENMGLALASDTEAYGGHLAKATELTKRAVDSAIRADSKETAAIWQTNAGVLQAAYGNPTEARQSAAEALKLVPTSQGVEVEAALGFALAGDTARAESLAQELNKRFPLDTQVQALWLPAIQAQLALNRKDATSAINLLQPALPPIEYGQIAFVANISCLYPTYIRGEAYLAAGQGGAAATEFQKIIDHSGIVWNCWTGALAHLGVARANALQAKNSQGADADAARVRALAAYKEFLTLWKDADPDIPILKEAKAEYAKLQ